MRINKLGCMALALAGTMLIGSASNASDRRGRFKLPPRNLILVIGDGMDDNQITIARTYLVGAFGELNLDRLPQRGAAQVLNYEEELPLKMSYVADSANSATSIATGGVTSTGRISTTVVEDKDLTTIFELAKAAGYKTGVVTTANVTDATPAAFLSHVSSRGCFGPNDMGPAFTPGGVLVSEGCPGDLKANGGKGSIAEQIADGKADVVLGGGTDRFDQLAEGSAQTVLQIAQGKGFNYVSNLAGLAGYTGSGRLLGLFSANNLPVKLTGPAATKVTLDAAGLPVFPTPFNCSAVVAFANVPSLAAMTEKAIEVLSKNNHKGFILMVESASVDKQAHSRNVCGQVGELEQLDEVVGMVREFAEDNQNTMVLVTADHGHAPQILDDSVSSLSSSYPLGHVARVNTADGSVMRVGYATSSGSMDNHTGIEVPVLAFGGHPQNEIKAFMPQPELFTIMKKQLLIR